MHNWLRCLRSGAHLGAISPQPPAGPPQPPAGPPAAPPVPPRGGPRGGWAWVVAMCPLLTPLQDPGVTSSPPLRRDRAGGPCLPRLHVTAGRPVRRRPQHAHRRTSCSCHPPEGMTAPRARPARRCACAWGLQFPLVMTQSLRIPLDKTPAIRAPQRGARSRG